MKIFDLIHQMKQSIIAHSFDYSSEYVNGYNAAIDDLETRIKDNIEVKL